VAETLFGINVSIHNIINSNALLLYKVGPVLVCSPTLPVESITIPPNLNSLPGTNEAEPGMFKSMHGMVRVVDLRVRFGVDTADRKNPGRIIISEATGGYVGFWVDEIEDVISFPEKGWSQLPAHVPKEAFSRALICDEGIRLYTDLENLDKFKATGYLRAHIENIKSVKEDTGKQAGNDSVEKRASQLKKENEQVGGVRSSDVSDNKKSTGTDNTSNTKLPLSGTVKKTASAIKEIKISNTKRSLSKDKNVHNVVDKKPTTKIPGVIKKENSICEDFARNARPVIQQNIINKDRKESIENKQTSDHENSLLIKDSDKKAPEEKQQGDMLWFSVLMLSFVAVSIYVVEFSGVFNDGVDKKVDIKKIQPEASNIKVINNHENETLNEIKDSLDYTDNAVDISKTDEGIIIVINDYEKNKITAFSEIEKERDENPLQKENDVIESTADRDVTQLEFERDDFDVIDRLKPDQSEVMRADTRVEKVAENTIVDDVYQEGLDEVAEANLVDSVVNEELLKSTEVTSNDLIKTLTSVHIVVKGDTLWDIAIKYVNNPWRYPELARLSKIKDPDLIYPGQKVIIIYNTNK